MPFRINKPTKTADSDRPNSLVVARSLAFVMALFPAFFVFDRERLERSRRSHQHTVVGSEYRKLA